MNATSVATYHLSATKLILFHFHAMTCCFLSNRRSWFGRMHRHTFRRSLRSSTAFHVRCCSSLRRMTCCVELNRRCIHERMPVRSLRCLGVASRRSATTGRRPAARRDSAGCWLSSGANGFSLSCLSTKCTSGWPLVGLTLRRDWRVPPVERFFEKLMKLAWYKTQLGNLSFHQLRWMVEHFCLRLNFIDYF